MADKAMETAPFLWMNKRTKLEEIDYIFTRKWL